MALGDEDLGALMDAAFGPAEAQAAAPALEDDIAGLVNDAFAPAAAPAETAPASAPTVPRALTVVPPDAAEPEEDEALSRLVNEAFSSAYPAAPKFIPRSPELQIERARTAKGARDAEINAGWAQFGMENPFAGRDLLDVAGNLAAGVTPDAYERQVHAGMEELKASVRAFGRAVGLAQKQRRQDINPIRSIIEENAPTYLNAMETIGGDPGRAIEILSGAGISGIARMDKESIRASWELIKAAGEKAWVTTAAPLSTFGKIIGTLDRPLAAFERADYEWRIAEHNKKAKKGLTDPATREPYRPIIDPSTGEPYPTTPRVRTFRQLKDEILSVMDPIPDNERENVSWSDVLKLRSLLHGGTGSEGWVLWGGLAGDLGLSPLNLVGIGEAAAPTKLARLIKISDPLIAAERLVDPVGATQRAMAKTTSILQEVDKGFAAKAADPILPIRMAAKELEAHAVATRGLAEEALYANRMADSRSLGRQADKYDSLAAKVNHVANTYNAKSVQIALPLAKAVSGGKIQPLDVLDIPTLDTKWRAREVVKIADRIREEQSVTAGRSIERLQAINAGTRGLKRTEEELDYITHVHEWPHEAAGRAAFKVDNSVPHGMDEPLVQSLEAQMASRYASALVRTDDVADLPAAMAELSTGLKAGLSAQSALALDPMLQKAAQRVAKDWTEYNAKLATLDEGMTVIHETVDAANREARYRVMKAAPEHGIEELDAYLAHVNQNKMRQMESLSEFQKVSPFEMVPRPNPTKHRVIRTTDEAQRLGFDPITNPLELATHTQVASRSIVTRENLKQEIIKQFGFETKGRIDPTRYVSFEYKGKTYAVPRDVKDGLAALDFVMSPFNWPEWMQKTGAVYNAVQNFWKRQVLAHPAFATVNALGNKWLAAIGGHSGDPRSTARSFALAQIGHLDRVDAESLAAKAMVGAKPEKVALSSARAASYGTAGALAGASLAGPVGMAVGGILGAGAGFAKSDLERLAPAIDRVVEKSKAWLRLDAEHQAKRVFFDPNGRKYTGRELYDWADGRVFESGWVAADAPTSKDIFKFQSDPAYRFARNVYHETLESVNPLGSQNVITKSINAANRGIENQQRFEFMLDRILVAGDDPLDAIDRTNAVFGNYKKQGKFGRALGKAFPFYKWIRTNARAEFEGVFRSPALFSAPEKVRTAFGKYYEGTVGERKRILSRDTAYYIQKAMGFPVPSSWFLDSDDSAERLVFATTNMPYNDINLLSMDAIDQWIGMMSPIFKAPSEVWKRRRFDTGERLDEQEIIPESLDPVGEWLAQKFPNDVIRENVKLADGTTKIGYAVPKYMLHLLRSIEPGPDRWEKLLIPRGEKEEAIRQSLRRQTELRGIVSGREIRPERETANVLKRGWNAETGRPRGGGGYERIRQLNAWNKIRFGQRPVEEK